LVVQLYDGAIRFVERAIRAHELANLEEVHVNLIRAQAIVTELRATLDRDAGPVADDLDRMYDMLYRKLVLANVSKDPTVAQEVLGYLTELLPTWQYVAQESMGGRIPVPKIRQPEGAGWAQGR
jgi:flagellar protein FliS